MWFQHNPDRISKIWAGIVMSKNHSLMIYAFKFSFKTFVPGKRLQISNYSSKLIGNLSLSLWKFFFFMSFGHSSGEDDSLIHPIGFGRQKKIQHSKRYKMSIYIDSFNIIIIIIIMFHYYFPTKSTIFGIHTSKSRWIIHCLSYCYQ